MGKILFNNKNIKLETETNSSYGLNNKFRSDRDILKKRSSKYVKLFSTLDISELTEVKGWNQLMETIKEEFGTPDLLDLPLGIVGKCFLGSPYEVHILDLSGSQIIQHYKLSEAMPPDFEKARSLAIHNSYSFIEVYKNKLVLIREDGSTTIL